MRRPKALVVIGIALVAILAIVVAGVALSGGDDNAGTTSRPSEAPSGDAPPPTPGALPQEFVECMADRGFEIQSENDIHSAPPQVLQACFGSLHRGGGGP
jgi:hypothetical protein